MSRIPSKSNVPAESYVPEVAQYQPPAPSMGMSPVGLGMSPAVAREVATVQAQMVVAKCYPRNLNLVMDNIAAICKSKELANNATYAYARGGSSITGPSIRLAEALAKSYGNMKYGTEETESSDTESVVRTFAFDMETNTLAERTFHVPHVRTTRSGTTVLSDPRDVYEAVANQASRRLRACILQIIPTEVTNYAIALCEETRRSNIDKGAEARKKMLEAFAKFDVSQEDIEAFIQRNYEAVDDSQWIRLREIYASLNDGIAKKEDFFKGPKMAEKKAEPVAQTTTPEPVKDEAFGAGPEAFEDFEGGNDFE